MGIIADDRGNANILDSCFWNWVSYTLRAPIPLGVGDFYLFMFWIMRNFLRYLTAPTHDDYVARWIAEAYPSGL